MKEVKSIENWQNLDLNWHDVPREKACTRPSLKLTHGNNCERMSVAKTQFHKTSTTARKLASSE